MITGIEKAKIGILGGTSPQSTVDYYNQLINLYLEQFNDHAYPEIIIYSVEFQKYIDWMNSGDWDKIEDDLISAIGKLEKAGADFGIIAAGTLHKVFPGVAKRANIPLLSMVDCVSEAAQELGINKIGLLGTLFTMTDSFFPDRLAQDGIQCIIPEELDLTTINKILFDELARGIATEESRDTFTGVIAKLESRGAQGVIFGCTEIPLLVSPEEVNLPVLDSTAIHVKATLRKALGLG